MLGWILLGGLALVGVVIISGMITKNLIKEKMRNKNIEAALIEMIDACTNTVKLKDLYGDKTMEIIGDDIDYELDEGDIIIA